VIIFSNCYNKNTLHFVNNSEKCISSQVKRFHFLHKFIPAKEQVAIGRSWDNPATINPDDEKAEACLEGLPKVDIFKE